jgi:hypothetical protein
MANPAINHTATMDLTGETAVEKPGCIYIALNISGNKRRGSYRKPKTRAIDGGPRRALKHHHY